MLDELAIVLAHEDQRMAFGLDQLVDLAIVVALVLAAEDKHRRRCHALQCIPTRIDISGLGVVDITHTTHGSHVLQTMVNSSKLLQTLANHIVVDIQYLRSNTRSHRVILIVLALQTQVG